MSNFYKKKYITNRSLDQFGNFSVKLIFSALHRKLETKQMYMRLSVEKRGRERTTPRHSRREKSLRLDKINVSSVSKTKKRKKKRIQVCMQNEMEDGRANRVYTRIDKEGRSDATNGDYAAAK